MNGNGHPATSLVELAGHIARSAAAMEKMILGRPAAAEDAGDEPTREDLLRKFVCDDSRAILRELVSRGPCRAFEVKDAVRGKVGKSAFWVLWKSLQVRGLVVEGTDDLFRIGPDWVRGMFGS